MVADGQTAGRDDSAVVRERCWREFALQSRALPRGTPSVGSRMCSPAAAMAEVLDCQVKWPNDLITANGHKLWNPGGAAAEAERVRFVVCVGIMNQTAFPGLPRDQPGARDRRVPPIMRGYSPVSTRLSRPSRPPGSRTSLWRARSHTLGRRVRG